MHVIHGALTTPGFHWGELVHLAVEQKVSCLVTDALDSTGLLRLAPTRLARFPQRARRSNQHTMEIHRHHAGRLAATALEAGLAIAACKGIAVENVLYGGRGAREFSGLDLFVAPEDLGALELILTGLGYQPHISRSSAHGAT
ncbi:nucleotidyltransferase family protein [Streptomyces atratus]|uniref:nucleotidyltransferase family protein n=1 Tax=Streptomyces atratus TaxID=1893 RepID=UPI0037994BC4